VVRVIDVFIDRLDISGLGFKAEAAETGRPGYHPRTMLKIYVYGHLNRVHSSKRLERAAKLWAAIVLLSKPVLVGGRLYHDQTRG
jgi:transposase